MAGRFIRGSHLRSLLPAVLLLAPALAVATILVGAFTGAERPTGADGVAPAEAATHGDQSRGRGGEDDHDRLGRRHHARIAVRPAANGGASLFANVQDTLRAPDLMAGNLEGNLSTGGASKCGAGAANCFAFQAPPANGRALDAAGLDVVNLANNHAFDYGEAGRTQTLGALTAAKVAFTGLPGDVRVLTRRGVRVAFVGFSTYRWTTSMDDQQAVRALIDQAAVLADVVVVFFHAGAEGADRTGVPVGREWAFGEDRGDSRAFAHLAIDAGADLVLGSGPHVVRGMETYRGRLIAYSLGNFAGVHNFASGGTLSMSGVLTVRVDRRGRLRNGWWHGIALDASGTPHPDQGASRALVAQLSTRDFGAAAPRLLPSGRILPSGAQVR